jgi:hypothetical protein
MNRPGKMGLAMANEEKRERVVGLLDAAASAHHEYEVQELDGMRDEAWPHWYAAHLLENGLDQVIIPAPNQGALAEFFAQSYAEYEAQHPDANWQIFTAEQLLARFGNS